MAAANMAQSDPGRSLITSYGLFWKVQDTEWVPGRKVVRRMLGRNGSKRKSIEIADFWTQSGIYVLYGNYGLYYVGIAGRLGPRLKRHLADTHAGKWDRFSWFGFKRVQSHRTPEGLLMLGKEESSSAIILSKARHDIEAILFRAFAGAGNAKNPHFGNKLRQWEQIASVDSKKFLARVQPLS